VNLSKSLCRLMTLPSDTYFTNGVSIPIFIDTMQRNFILTDVMKTGDHNSLEDFISMSSLPQQEFVTSGEYHSIHDNDLDAFDRRFAIIEIGKHLRNLKQSDEFLSEIKKRCDLLHSQGFVFIKSNPWESKENLESMENHPWVDVEHIKWTGDASWFWFYMYRKHKDNRYKFSHDDKKFDFLYLNKTARPHRKELFTCVRPLMANSLYTNWEENIKLPHEYELPWATNYPKYGMDQDIFELPYSHTKYSLVSETNDNNTDVFMTEKIWKPIIAQHPFVVHGNYLYLQKLREMGFKTFANYFDESYDLEADKGKRIGKIVNTCRDLLSDNWQDIYLRTQALRQHNHDTFFDREKLSLEINKTLELFLEFADSR